MTGVEIGREPALSLSAQQEPGADRRFLNLRWLACTVLTGLAAAALMGGALYIALDRQAHLAGLDANGGPRHAGLAGKADRIAVAPERISSRQVIQETAVRSVNGKEFVKVMPYVRVTASLATRRGRYAEQAPTFNPLEIFADVGAWKDDRPSPDEEPGDEHLEVRFAALTPYAGHDETDVLAFEEIEQTLRQTISLNFHEGAHSPPVILPVANNDTPWPGARSGPGPALPGLLHTAAADPNMTTVLKRNGPMLASATEVVTVEVQNGDTLMSILVGHGATRGEAMELISAIDAEARMPTLRVGQEIRLTLAPSQDDAERVRPIRVSLNREDGTPLNVAVADPGAYTRLGALRPPALRRTSSAASSRDAPGANVYEGIYETGLRHDIPVELVDELVRIFAFDVDFQRSVSPGDAIEVFYAETGEETDSDAPEILHAAIRLRGDTHRFYRFRTPDDGYVDYYDEEGNSAKKFLVRKPLSGGTFRSGFGMRRHPILGYTRMHAGVDWSARTGTPIMAAGSGTVIDAQWKSGYGNHVSIRHANGYATSYSHMSEFASGIRPGARVTQGQVIGYVGSTGMSTGPHLHYEVTVNGRHVDPMRVQLPRGRSLEGRMLAAFEKERARIDALMNRAPASTRLAAR